MQQAKWAEFFRLKAVELGLEDEVLLNPRLQELIQCGHDTILKQLPFESPEYAPSSLKYREADAALLNLIFPCTLKSLSETHFREILKTIEPLMGEKGVKRYLGDSYQSANYWLEDLGKEEDSRTGDHSCESAFQNRQGKTIPGTEAEWFFDSWISLVYGKLYAKTGGENDFEKQIWFLERSLKQLTQEGMLGADGKPVLSNSFPESYNTVIRNGKREYLPSPITPLNWAKASARLALEELKKNLLLREDKKSQ
jgi:hypothetical protein